MCCIVVSSEKGLLVTSFHLQKDVVQFSDYDVLHDADTDTSRSTQDHGLGHFSHF